MQAPLKTWKSPTKKIPVMLPTTGATWQSAQLSRQHETIEAWLESISSALRSTRNVRTGSNIGISRAMKANKRAWTSQNVRLVGKMVLANYSELATVGQIFEACIVRKVSSHILFEQCLEPDNSDLEWWPLTGLRTQRSQYTARFQAELNLLKGLTDGWGEGDELAPTEATLKFALDLERQIREEMMLHGHRYYHPNLTPGVRGQIQLEYSRTTAEGLQKDLFIQVPRYPDREETLILRGTKDSNGQVIETKVVGLEREIDTSIKWLLDS